jgi:hypothetical protein
MSCCSCDNISKFVKEMIVQTNVNTDKVKKRELLNEFKNWFNTEQGVKMPSGEDLNAYMDKKFCKNVSGCWHGVKILYPDVEEYIDNCPKTISEYNVNLLLEFCKQHQTEFKTLAQMREYLDEAYLRNLTFTMRPYPESFKQDCEKVAFELKIFKYSFIH